MQILRSEEIKKTHCTSIAACNDAIVALNCEGYQDVHIIKIDLPKKCSLFVTKTILRHIVPSFQIHRMFYVNMMGEGGWDRFPNSLLYH